MLTTLTQYIIYNMRITGGSANEVNCFKPWSVEGYTLSLELSPLSERGQNYCYF